MRLKTMGIQNFMSIRKAEVPLENQGLILIQGKNLDDPAFESNGAGKSTISEALVWAIYDKTVRGLSGDEVVNNKIKKNTNVWLDFEDDNKSQYRISRYRKHNEHKNNCNIFKDGVNITPKSTKDANKMIESIIGMSFNTFLNSILFGQGAVKLFSVATDKEKKEILEQILQIDEFNRLLDTTKQRLSSKKSDLSEILAEDKKTLHLIEEVEQTISQLERAELEDSKRVEEEVGELKEELKTANKELSEHMSSSNDYSARLGALEAILKKVEDKLASFKQYEDMKSNLSLDKRDQERELERSVKAVKEGKEELEKIAQGKGTNCPVCGQDISDESIQSAMRHVAVKMAEHKNMIKHCTSVIAELSEDLATISKALEGKDKLTKQKDTILGEISEINASIRAEANLRKSLQSRVDNLESSIEKLEAKKGTTYRPLIEEKSKQLSVFEQKLEDNKGQRGAIEKEISDLEFWVEGFGNSGIKSYLLDNVTHILNKKSNEYLSKLAGSTTTIEFSTQTRLTSGELRDKFEVRILNAVGGESYTANSTGEKRRIDLAISLALQHLVKSRSNGRLNYLLYDEIFDGLDAVGCENAIQLLMEIQQEVESIHVITHNDILKAYFDKYLIATKEGGATRVHRE
ncbi:exonuclease activity protein [Lysinibacillus phage vB_LfM_LysYB1]|nr:exonuclease activity protein [Lysinibacillus phage vB_LfM_LysYB1]WAB25226.1 exonuclease activity protein [Lysinibacillus phage vB_LfM_LysYB2]